MRLVRDAGVGSDRFAVNLGANDGATSDPVAGLFHDGWSGVAVELEARHYSNLHLNLGSTNATLLCPLAATPENIVPLLEASGAQPDFDYLKVITVTLISDTIRAEAHPS